MDAALEALLAPLRAQPRRTALAFDFDGTLSDVVEDPAAAVARPGAAELLDQLAHRYRRVAVVSGRPVAFLAAALPPSVLLSGLYGLELLVDGQRVEDPSVAPWRDAVARAVASATEATAPGTDLAGALVEGKGLSLTLHVRAHPELWPGVDALAARVAAETGLERRPAKQSVELHPPVEADKGRVLSQVLLAHGETDGLLYVGDDVGDLPAFDAVAAWRAAVAGRRGVAVAVAGAESPPAIVAAADAVVDGPAGVVELLAHLAS